MSTEQRTSDTSTTIQAHLDRAPAEWAPLIKVGQSNGQHVGTTLSMLEDSMYMWEEDGLYAYKHIMSRQYLYTDGSGRCFSPKNRNRVIGRAAAIKHFVGRD